MADPSGGEFGSWLRPRDALAKIGEAKGGAPETEIAARILRGSIRIAGKCADKAGGERVCITDRDYLHGPWHADWGAFWSSSQVSFVRIPTPMDGVARLKIVGPAKSFGQPEIHIFREVRLDPVALASEFDLDRPLDAAASQQERLLGANKGGRPGGKHGEPVARITERLLAAPNEARWKYKAEALRLELRDKYLELRLDPPSEANLRRLASGILKAVRK